MIKFVNLPRKKTLYVPVCADIFGFMLSALVVVSQLAVSSRTVRPCKGHDCPSGPVNWLITSLMHMEQFATMAALSGGRVTSEPKTRTRLIWRNVPGADQIPEK